MKYEKSVMRCKKFPLEMRAEGRCKPSTVDGSPGCCRRNHRAPLEPVYKSCKLVLRLTLPFIFLILFSGTLSGQTADSESSNYPANTPLGLSLSGQSYPFLEEYLQTAINQNPELQSMRYRADAEMERAREAGILPDPELNIAYDFNPMMSESVPGRFSVSAMQMFPWFGTLRAKRSAEEAMASAGYAQADARQLQILRDIKTSWFDIAEVREQIRITQENLELLSELEVLVEIRYETARAGQADILRIQMESERLQTQIQDLQDQLTPLQADFNRLLNRDLNEEVRTGNLEVAELIAPKEEIRNRVRSHPTFEELSAKRESAEEQRKLARYNGRPSFGLGVEVMGRGFGPMSMFPDATESIIGMASIRLPLFRSRTSAQKRQADLQIQSIREQEDQTENSLVSRLECGLEQFRKSERGIKLLDDELIPRAERALSILTEEYSAGNARFDEMLQIQRELLNLQMERVETVVSQNKALANIESLMGT